MSIFNIDIVELVRVVGYLGLFVIIFSESGVFFGFFLPGGSLLFTAGLLASQGLFNVYWLILVVGVAAILGDNVGYWFGSKVGHRIFNKEDSLFFNKKYLDKTKEYYEKYGAMTVVIGRFVPIVRTFAPILAGVGGMNYKKFLIFNIIGALLWAVGLSLLGFFLGSSIPGIEKYIMPIIFLIIFLSILPIIFNLAFKKRHSFPLF
ncbi:MAG: VTT domain-containing protein [Patescibacteria group bacterium]